MPLINEVFGTSYPEDILLIQKRNEHQTKQGEIITDSYFLIADKAYHIECQSTSDSSMIIRMIEYDFSISLESLQLEDGKYRMYFPNSCILFLRGNADRKMLGVEIVMPDGSTTKYKVPAIYVGHYTKKMKSYRKNCSSFFRFILCGMKRRHWTHKTRNYRKCWRNTGRLKNA